MAAIMETDTPLWLHNKLGSNDNQWSSGGIASHFNRTVLRNVYDCFLQLDGKAKIKLLLSFLEIPLRNMEDLQDIIEDICDLADSDTDEWVKVASNIVKDYPIHHVIDKSLGKVATSFQETVQEVITEVERFQSPNIMTMLPLECAYLNRTALSQMVPNPPAPIKHFTLRRKPKSAALRDKITQKGILLKDRLKPTDAANQRRLSQSATSAGKASLKRTNSTPNRLQSVSHTKAGLSKVSALPKKTKLLDITEQPLGAREQKKRKKMLALEASMEEAKRKHAAELKEQNKHEDLEDDDVEKHTETTEIESDIEHEHETDGIHSGPDKEENLSTQTESSSAQHKPKTPEPTTPTPSYALLPGSTPTLTPSTNELGSTKDQPSPTSINVPPMGIHGQPASGEHIGMHQRPENTAAGFVNIDPTASYNTQNLQRELQMRVQQERELRIQQQQQQQQQQRYNAHMYQQHLQNLQQQQQQQQKPTYPAHSTNMAFGPPPPSMGLQHQLSQMHQAGLQPPPPTPPPGMSGIQSTIPAAQQKKGLSLTREQMLAAQEMFRSANRVTRAEKALILGFMAGARDNPFPQQGAVITIKLSEETEVQHNQDGPQTVFIEMLFEMNYETGHWRRLKRTRVVSQP